MKLDELFRELFNYHGADVAFISNVVFTTSPNRGKRLRGLHHLVTVGKDIRTGDTIDTFRVDGEQRPLSFLEKV